MNRQQSLRQRLFSEDELSIEDCDRIAQAIMAKDPEIMDWLQELMFLGDYSVPPDCNATFARLAAILRGILLKLID